MFIKYNSFVNLKLRKAVHIKNLYCFQYTSSNEDLIKTAGWEFFKLENEYKRMRVPNDKWTLCSLNQNYELCDTYPRQIYVPSEASTAMLIGSSRFRSKGRLPALTYLHTNKASICRCSQPLSGFSARCLEDEVITTAEILMEKCSGVLIVPANARSHTKYKS